MFLSWFVCIFFMKIFSKKKALFFKYRHRTLNLKCVKSFVFISCVHIVLCAGPRPEASPFTGYFSKLTGWTKNSSALAVACFIGSVYHYSHIFFPGLLIADCRGQTPLQETWTRVESLNVSEQADVRIRKPFIVIIQRCITKLKSFPPSVQSNNLKERKKSAKILHTQGASKVKKKQPIIKVPKSY